MKYGTVKTRVAIATLGLLISFGCVSSAIIDMLPAGVPKGYVIFSLQPDPETEMKYYNDYNKSATVDYFRENESVGVCTVFPSRESALFEPLGCKFAVEPGMQKFGIRFQYYYKAKVRGQRAEVMVQREEVIIPVKEGMVTPVKIMISDNNVLPPAIIDKMSYEYEIDFSIGNPVKNIEK